MCLIVFVTIDLVPIFPATWHSLGRICRLARTIRPEFDIMLQPWGFVATIQKQLSEFQTVPSSTSSDAAYECGNTL